MIACYYISANLANIRHIEFICLYFHDDIASEIEMVKQ